MKIKKFNEQIESDIIKKIDNFSEEDMIESNSFGTRYEGWINFANIYKFIDDFYKINDIDTRRNKNPHGIKYDRMLKEFGEPNFSDEGDYWWILEYKGEKYAVSVSLYGEGSYIFKYDENETSPNDKKLNQDAQNFYDQLFTQI